MKNKISFLLIFTILLISACQADSAVVNNSEDIPTSDEDSRMLTVCLAYEPESLYPYAASSHAAQDVLQAIYDGPIDLVNGQAVPVILSYLPSYQDDSARLVQVDVQAGDPVVDVYGDVTNLQAGTKVFPSGCRETACSITWDGTSAIQMDQPVANFELLAGLTWSDGVPLIAANSVYSFRLAGDAETPGNKTYNEHTASYSALDETTIEWKGLPGLLTDQFEDYFWMPLPEHAWDQYSPAELLASETVARNPLGWGPYVMDEWIEGEYIRLKKNPNYFRAEEGLPKFDMLTFKITDPFGDTNMANLKFDREPYAQFDFDVGEFDQQVNQNGCDLISSTVDVTDQLNVINILMNYFSDAVVQVHEGLGKQAQWLLFNQRTYVDGQNTLFSSTTMRSAVAACLERGELAETVFFNLVDIPQTISLDYPESDADPNSLLQPDRASGMALLNESGWVDGDPRTAQSIEGFEEGAPLSIDYLVSDDALSMAVANHNKQSLGECGMQVNLISVSPEVLWDRTESESIFKGNYHMVQLEWPLPLQDPCALFASNHLPSEENEFLGLNFSGFSNGRLDAICEELQSTHLSVERQALLNEIEAILNSELALVPLYSSADLMVTRNDFCEMDSGSNDLSELAQIESFDYGETCLP